MQKFCGDGGAYFLGSQIAVIRYYKYIVKLLVQFLLQSYFLTFF